MLIPIGAMSTTAAALLMTFDSNIVPSSKAARVPYSGSHWPEEVQPRPVAAGKECSLLQGPGGRCREIRRAKKVLERHSRCLPRNDGRDDYPPTVPQDERFTAEVFIERNP
jgi:hypothetical protein